MATAKASAPADFALAKCDKLTFISASRCKVEQCSKPQFRARAECGPVLAQQRLIEQKRNPSMFN
ncbi:hypothetical protein QTI66_14865 [Variovorax sp. J22R133]|uniref:hypothetical protein n=1 Tax=Variovorax brevis TaxID=3053503 RepID=UPI002577E54C|nr:hypothetical protein [Variovorax sp. J22R133]MDM0113438.1 hypothetical protein [Variovorax sp. J22R133]